MTKEHFSLCIPSYNFEENKVDSQIWRIADFLPDEGKIIPAPYTKIGDKEFLPRRIYAQPTTTIPYKPSIFCWTVDDNRRIDSDNLNISPIEVIIPEKNFQTATKTDNDVREFLYHGFDIHEHISDEFFLIITEKPNYYHALKLKRRFSADNNKQFFRIERTCQNIQLVIHTVEVVILEKKYLLDTSDCFIIEHQNQIANTRYFYSFLSPPPPIRMFHVREAQDYLKAFLSKYIKINSETLSLTKKDRQKVINVVDLAINDKNELADFFKETGYTLQDLESSTTNLSSELKELLSGEYNFIKFMKDIFESDPELQKKYTEIAKEIWLTQSDENRQRLKTEQELELKKLEKLTAQSTLVIKEHNTYHTKLEELKKIQETKELLLCKLEKQVSEVEQKIASSIKCFQEDLVHLASFTAFTNTRATSDQATNSGFVCQPGENLKNDDETADTIIDLTEDFQQNLILSGIDREFAYALSKILISLYVINKNIILDGNPCEIADAFAALIDGKKADKIFFTNMLIDLDLLSKQINNLTSNIILIYGALDTYNEKILINLSLLCPNKTIFFACEDMEIFNSLPSHWDKYAFKIPVAKNLIHKSHEQLYSYTAKPSLFPTVANLTCTLPEGLLLSPCYTQKLAYEQLLRTALCIYGEFETLQSYLQVKYNINKDNE